MYSMYIVRRLLGEAAGESPRLYVPRDSLAELPNTL